MDKANVTKHETHVLRKTLMWRIERKVSRIRFINGVAFYKRHHWVRRHSADW